MRMLSNVADELGLPQPLPPSSDEESDSSSESEGAIAADGEEEEAVARNPPKREVQEILAALAQLTHQPATVIFHALIRASGNAAVALRFLTDGSEDEMWTHKEDCTMMYGEDDELAALVANKGTPASVAARVMWLDPNAEHKGNGNEDPYATPE